MDINGFHQLIHSKIAVFALFSTPDCAICHALRPKLQTLLSVQFPAIHFVEINSAESPDIAAQYGVFTSPVMIVFFEGKESIRKIRNVSLPELTDWLQRPYALLFEESGS